MSAKMTRLRGVVNTNTLQIKYKIIKEFNKIEYE